MMYYAIQAKQDADQAEQERKQMQQDERITRLLRLGRTFWMSNINKENELQLLSFEEKSVCSRLSKLHSGSRSSRCLFQHWRRA